MHGAFPLQKCVQVLQRLPLFHSAFAARAGVGCFYPIRVSACPSKSATKGGYTAAAYETRSDMAGWKDECECAGKGVRHFASYSIQIHKDCEIEKTRLPFAEGRLNYKRIKAQKRFLNQNQYHLYPPTIHRFLLLTCCPLFQLATCHPRLYQTLQYEDSDCCHSQAKYGQW